jgi:hypothetical protein
VLVHIRSNFSKQIVYWSSDHALTTSRLRFGHGVVGRVGRVGRVGEAGEIL